jgi:hypothetical protein
MVLAFSCKCPVTLETKWITWEKTVLPCIYPRSQYDHSCLNRYRPNRPTLRVRYFLFYLRIILWLVLRLFIITCSFKSSCNRMDFGLTVFTIICASGEEPNI